MSSQDATSLNQIVNNANGNDDVDERSSTSSRIKNPNFMKGSRQPLRPPPRHQYPTSKPDQSDHENNSEKFQNNSEKSGREDKPYPSSKNNLSNEEHSTPRIVQPSVLQHKLTLILQSSAAKEQQYTNMIKSLKQELFNVTESYMDTLTHYKKQLHLLVQKKDKEDELRQKYHRIHELHHNKNPPSKYKLIECDQGVLQTHDLSLEIRVLDLQFVFEDYISQKIVKKIKIKLSGWSSSLSIESVDQLEGSIGEDVAQQQITYAITNSYPLEIHTKQLNHPTFKHRIKYKNQSQNSNIESILEFLRAKSLGIQIIDMFSMLPFCSGRIDLEQFLFCNQDGEEEQWISKIPLFSEQNPSQIACYIHVECVNCLIPKANSHQHLHKSSEPLNMVPKKMGADRQARIVQRISSFKNQQTSIIPHFHEHQLSLNDKLLLQHKKRRELEQIQEYRETNKKEYMDKILKEAVQLYQTQTYHIGQCRYLSFVYTNTSSRAQRISIDVRSASKTANQDKNSKIKGSDHQIMNIEVLKPDNCYSLLESNIIKYPPNCSDDMLDYNIESDGKILVLSGYSILVFAKVIIHSLDRNFDRQKVSFHVFDEFGEQIHQDMYILKLTSPETDHKFSIDMARCQQIRLKLNLEPSQNSTQNEGHTKNTLGKAKAINILKVFGTPINKQSDIQFQYFWQDALHENLEVRVECGKKAVFSKDLVTYIFIYDSNYLKLEACYQIAITVCPVLDFIDQSFKMVAIENSGQEPKNKENKIHKKMINIGEVATFLFDLKIPVEAENSNNKVLVRLGCSDITNQYFNVNHQASKQFLAETNKSYPIQINCLTFKEKPKTLKETITVVDGTTNRIIQKYLFFLEKLPCSYRKILTLHCPSNNETFITTLDLYNPPTNKNVKEKNYRIKSSNPSFIRPPTQSIILLPGQTTKAKMQVQFWSMGADFESRESFDNNSSKFTTAKKVKDVVISVDDGTEILLYLYQLREE